MSDEEDWGNHAEGPPPKVSWRDFIETFDSQMTVKFVAVFTVWFAAGAAVLQLADVEVLMLFSFAVIGTQLLTME